MSDYKIYFDNQLKNWTVSFRNFQLSSFNISATSGLREFSHLDTTTSDWRNFYELYKAALTFSNDSSKFVDIYSYDLNLEKKGKKIVANYAGEQEVTLYDLKAGKEGVILFCGISQQIQEVAWITNAKFILVGREIEDTNTVRPIIFLADLYKQKIIRYQTVESSCLERKAIYSSPKLNRLHYEEE